VESDCDQGHIALSREQAISGLPRSSPARPSRSPILRGPSSQIPGSASAPSDAAHLERQPSVNETIIKGPLYAYMRPRKKVYPQAVNGRLRRIK
jgi:hypothetical protein